VKIQKGSLAACAVFLACLGFFLVASTIGWHHSILDGNQWRETQTAISAYYMVGRRPVLAYETPLVGPPWSIPFEFPLYQWTIAGLVTVVHAPLEQTGRAVNLAFFLLTLIPAYYLLWSLGIRRWQRMLILCLFLLSPFYVFWSRTFTIESTALFLCASYSALAVENDRQFRTSTALAAIGLGCLAALVKITTLLPFLLVAPLISAARAARTPAMPPSPVDSDSSSFPHAFAVRQNHGSRAVRRLVRMAIVFLPILAGICWTYYADGIKAENPIARKLTSQAMTEWNFGTLGQRLQPQTWATIFERWGQVVGSLGVLATAAFAVLLAGRRRVEFFSCLALALCGPLVFFNLHLVHDYYTYANGIFLIGAVGIAVVAVLEKGWSWIGGGLFFLMAAACLVRYGNDFYPRLANDSEAFPEIRAVADSARKLTRPDEVLLILGLDWSPAIPYYSQRRALMIPGDVLRDLLEKPADWVKRLAPFRVGALIIGEKPNEILDPVLLQSVFKAFDIDPRGQDVAAWYLLFPRRNSRQITVRESLH
jgi:hypothetical protein